MSFILDALKKSENERQQRGQGEFATVPASRESSRPPAWLWLLAALLVINLVVLLGLVLRSPGDRLAAEPGASRPAQTQAAVPEQRVALPPPVETVSQATPPDRVVAEPVAERPAEPAVQSVVVDTPQTAVAPERSEICPTTMRSS